MLEALRGRHELAVLSLTTPVWAEVNRFYGTALGAEDVIREPLSPWIRTATKLLSVRGDLLKHALLRRAASSSGARYDVLISANNEADLGCPSIQYIHYPTHLRPRPVSDLRWYHSIPFLLPAYYWVADRLAGFSAERMKRNLTLTNSDWTGRIVQRLHGISTRTVYPPVVVPVRDVPWSERSDAFICIGRLGPEKDLDRVIDIVAGVRRVVPHATLCLAGTPGPRRYHQHLLDRVRAAGGWISLRENLSRHDLLELVSRHRYGVHGMAAEHFGMAPAEMAAAGCIVFVPNDGGQVEIVGGDRRLVYETVDGAVAAIVRVMSDGAEQQALREMLKTRAQLFSVERFASTFREIVEQSAQTHECHPPRTSAHRRD
jgi:glycosyltransferase involved in cell wall biosynthesis